jgi:hypothetical protein
MGFILSQSWVKCQPVRAWKSTHQPRNQNFVKILRGKNRSCFLVFFSILGTLNGLIWWNKKKFEYFHLTWDSRFYRQMLLTWSISNWSTLNAGSSLRQCCHGNTIIFIFILFFVQQGKNSWTIIAFNYITMNFRNMYCRYVVLHFVSFDLN